MTCQRVMSTQADPPSGDALDDGMEYDGMDLVEPMNSNVEGDNMVFFKHMPSILGR